MLGEELHLERTSTSYHDAFVLRIITVRSRHGHSLPASDVLLIPTCWIPPPQSPNASDLGSVAGLLISSGSNESAAVKLAVVVFGTWLAPLFKAASAWSILVFCDSGAWHNVCLCGVCFWWAFVWGSAGSHTSDVSWQTSETKRDIIELFSCYFSSLQEVSC